jgi:hypothetical protein
MRWGLADCMKETINTNKIIVGTPEEERADPRLRRKWDGKRKGMRIWTVLLWLRLGPNGWLL